MASLSILSLSKPITKRLLSHVKVPSDEDQVYKVVKTILKKLSNKDLLELERSLLCQGKEATSCVVINQSPDSGR